MILSTKACEYIDSLAKGARMRIESLANTISLNYNDAIDYVMCFGGKVEYRPNQSSEFIKKDDDNFIIYVKQMNIEEVLHELGHALLNWDSNSDRDGRIVTYNNSGIFTYDEQAANYFMRTFIMPSEIFVKEVLETTYNNVCDFKALAEKFNVSKHVVIARGNDLGLWA